MAAEGRTGALFDITAFVDCVTSRLVKVGRLRQS